LDREIDHWSIAPWHYELLAIVRHKLHELDGEIEVSERLAAQDHAPGSMPVKTETAA
jgi:hypothetical protein